MEGGGGRGKGKEEEATRAADPCSNRVVKHLASLSFLSACNCEVDRSCQGFFAC